MTKKVKTSPMRHVHFHGFSISMTAAQAAAACHVGDCYSDIQVLSNAPEIRRQLDGILQYDMLTELEEYGAWSGPELDDVEENKLRILWVAAGRIYDEDHER